MFYRFIRNPRRHVLFVLFGCVVFFVFVSFLDGFGWNLRGGPLRRADDPLEDFNYLFVSETA